MFNVKWAPIVFVHVSDRTRLKASKLRFVPSVEFRHTSGNFPHILIFVCALLSHEYFLVKTEHIFGQHFTFFIEIQRKFNCSFWDHASLIIVLFSL